MADFDIGSFMKDIVSGLATLSESVQVIGQPVEVGGKIVIPAVVTRMGFGAGGGGGSTPSDGEDGEREEGSGGGGGGGVTMTPVFLVVDDEGERLLTVSGPLDRACSVVEKAKEALDRAMPRKEPSEEEEIEEAFDDLEDESPGDGPAH
jgi:uncharacterized spore protein YtfJ